MQIYIFNFKPFFIEGIAKELYAAKLTFCFLVLVGFFWLRVAIQRHRYSLIHVELINNDQRQLKCEKPTD